jgi:hypothetical protein
MPAFRLNGSNPPLGAYCLPYAACLCPQLPARINIEAELSGLSLRVQAIRIEGPEVGLGSIWDQAFAKAPHPEPDGHAANTKLSPSHGKEFLS